MIRVIEKLAPYREFRDDLVVPLENALLQEGFGAVLPRLHELRAEGRRRSLWAPFLPQEWGGLGLSLAEFAPISEVMGWTPLGHFVLNCQAPDVGNMELLLQFGTPGQKERYLKPLAYGDIRSCFAMTEPERAGSNPTWLTTTARREGDSWVIDGHKWFASGADGASFAVVMAVTEPNAPKPHQRASMIVVPMDTPGLHHVRRIKVMGEEGEDWHSHSELRFENCRVPLDNVIGEPGQGFALAQVRLGPGRVHHCMRWIGICERALDLMCRRATTRETAPGVLLASQQSVQHAIAESRAEIDAARLLIRYVADNYEAIGQKGLRTEISTIKFYTANVLQRVLDRAIQAHGGMGVSDETVLAYWYRHERCARIYDGADEVHKNLVAREILKGYGVKL